jgi:hypothetical protein
MTEPTPLRGQRLTALVSAALAAVFSPIASSARADWEPVPLVTAAMRDRGIAGGEGTQQIMALAASESGDLFLVGTDVGGIFRSENGRDWEPANIGLRARGGWAFAIDPADSDHLLVVAGNKSNTDSGTAGIYRSTDRGVTWTQRLAQPREPGDRLALVFDPTESLPAGLSRRAYFSGRTQGLFRSEDGGGSWSLLTSEHANSHLGVARDTGRLYVAGPSGFLTSDDRGATFATRRAAPSGGLSTPDAATVYVTEGTSIFRSTDRGETWTAVSTTGIPFATGQSLTYIAVNPADHRQILVNRSAPEYYNHRAFSTRDGGATWTQFVFDNQNSFIPYNGRPTSFLWVGGVAWAEGGDWITRSTDGGRTFAWSSSGLNGIMLGGMFAFSPTRPSLLFFGAQDYNGALTTDGGHTWTYQNASGHGWGGNLYGGHAATPEVLFGGGGGWDPPRTLRVKRNGVWSDTGLVFTGLDASYSSPRAAAILFASNWRSTDNGATWHDMAAAGVAVPCHGVLTHHPVTLDLYGVARVDTTSHVVRSTDDGATWQILSSVTGMIRDLAYDHMRDRIWLSVRSNTQNQIVDLMFTDLRNGAWTTPARADPYPPNDSVGAWARARINTVAVDPVDPSIVYLGSSRSYYRSDNNVIRSLDGGLTWENLSLRGTPPPGRRDAPSEVVCVRVHPVTRYLWVGTGCFGFWKLPPPGHTALADPSPIEISLPREVVVNRSLPLTNDTAIALTARLTVPDLRGYSVATSRESGGPAYVWQDIAPDASPAGGGTTLTDLNNQNDALSSLLSIGFGFPLFGELHQQLSVSTNGSLHFGARPASALASDTDLPAAGFGASLFPAWDDLRLFNNTTPPSRIHYAKPEAGVFVVQYSDVRQSSRNGARVSFQVRLAQSGEILVHYRHADLDSSLGYTVGVQNTDRSRFVQIARGGDFLASGLSLRLRPTPQWFGSQPAALSLAAGAHAEPLLSFDTRGLSLGLHTTTLSITTDGDLLPPQLIPIRLTVREDTPTEAWRRLHFDDPLALGVAAADDADPDGDGIPNLLEYALGLSPVSADTTVNAFAYDTDSSGRLRVGVVPLRDDLLHVVEFSGDLIDWPHRVLAAGPAGVEVLVHDPEPGPRRFARLVIERAD